MPRVDYDELEPSSDFLLMDYAGKPFSGVAYENNENGNLFAETNFVEGQKSGVSREWSDAGTLVREQWFALNSLHGPSREWYATGSRKYEGFFELGICVREQEWDENGNETKSYRIDEEGAQFAILKKLRTSDVGLLIGKLDFPA